MQTMQSLTDLQRQLFEWLQDYIDQYQRPPSYRQMAEAMGLKSPAPIQSRLALLEEKGYIERIRGQARSIRILKPRRKGVPILGAIAAGGLVETFVEEEVEIIPPELFSLLGKSNHEISKLFAVRVRGDSMIEALIAPGDVVVLEPPTDPKSVKNDTIIAARVGDKMTLKYFQRVDKRTVRLQPANPRYTPTYVDAADLSIQGVYVAVLRGLV